MLGWCGVDWIDLTHYGENEGSCEWGSELLGFIKCWEVPEWLHN
jgi:hypothetical protein